MNQATVEKIIKHYQQVVPVRMTPLCMALGIKLKKTRSWGEDVSGAIVKEDGQYTIWTNANHPLVRRRFTIAHEVAHFVLHRDAIGDWVHDDAMYRSNLSGILERQANQYAADLLMPWPLIIDQIEKGVDTIATLAASFRVSKTAMSIRLGIPWE